jgi:hypothetical protein
MNSLWDIRIFLGLVPKESLCISVTFYLLRVVSISCLYFTREGMGQEVEPTPCDIWSCVISCMPWLYHSRLDTTVPWARSRTEHRERDHPSAIAVTVLNYIGVVLWDVRDCRIVLYAVRYKHIIYPERTLLQCHLFTTNLTWTDLGSNQGSRGERPPATNRLNHGTAWI